MPGGEPKQQTGYPKTVRGETLDIAKHHQPSQNADVRHRETSSNTRRICLFVFLGVGGYTIHTHVHPADFVLLHPADFILLRIIVMLKQVSNFDSPYGAACYPWH